MRLASISFENFRNYKQISINVDADLVLILGENASGKTNFLEAIYFLSRLKSFRAPDALLVKHQEHFFKLTGGINEKKIEIAVQINPALRRQYKIDDQKIKRGFWQGFASILFVPNDLNLFQLGPILRRKYLDETLSQIDATYTLDLESLDHVLKQKAALLDQIYKQQAAREQLKLWNEELAPIAIRITRMRQAFIDFLNQRFSVKVNELMGYSSVFQIQYKRSFSQTQEEFLQNLVEHESEEIRSGKNLIGPHRDDFTVEKDTVLNLYNSSRGELRSQILALKLLQADYLTEKGKQPIILLDDVFSELDEIRRIKLLENLKDRQIFITSTEEHHLPRLTKETLLLKVEANDIKIENHGIQPNNYKVNKNKQH